MTQARFAELRGPGTLGAGVALLVVTALSWTAVVRNSQSMRMPVAPSWIEASAFVAQWGVMMAAMMLPSAAPTILLYRTVRRGLLNHERAVPATVFGGVYVLVWLLIGVPVYFAYIALNRWPLADAIVPYAMAAALILAGVYQFSNAKRGCLRYCEAPLTFLMRRWRSGYQATLRIAFDHAAYCIGCCWALMLVLVAVGAMSLAWVLTIAVLVFAEKALPHGWRTARVIGAALIVLGIAVVLNPELANVLRGPSNDMPGM